MNSQMLYKLFQKIEEGGSFSIPVWRLTFTEHQRQRLYKGGIKGTHRSGFLINTDIKVLNKILANEVSEYIERIKC